MSSSEVAALEADVKEYQQQLDTVVASLQGDPGNAELQTLQAELEEAISVTQSAITDLAPASTQQRKKSTPPAAPVEEKWSKDKHPAFQPGYKRPGAPPSPPPDDPPAAASFKVNDTVLAKWISGDKAFYPARITAITGSSAAPIYNVTFKSYNTSDTLRASDIKPLSNDPKKRKADGPPASQPLPAAAANSNVISAAADIDPTLASQAKREPSKVSDGPTRPPKVARKVKATKELEAGKSKWQNFSTKGKFGKAAKKDSMFRTGESINARVGFTGSGHAMRKDPARSKHIYQAGDDDG